MITSHKNFKEAFQSMRNQVGANSNDIAKKLNWSRQRLWQVENTEGSNRGLRVLAAYARKLGFSTTVTFTRNGQKVEVKV